MALMIGNGNSVHGLISHYFVSPLPLWYSKINPSNLINKEWIEIFILFLIKHFNVTFLFFRQNQHAEFLYVDFSGECRILRFIHVFLILSWLQYQSYMAIKGFNSFGPTDCPKFAAEGVFTQSSWTRFFKQFHWISSWDELKVFVSRKTETGKFLRMLFFIAV